MAGHGEESVLPLIGYRPCLYTSYALGVLFGIFAFSETFRKIDVAWNSSYMGRFTIMDWLGLPTGWKELIWNSLVIVC